MGYVHLTCRLLLGGVLIVALAKIRSRASWREFLTMVRAVTPLPSSLVRPAAAVVVLAESGTVVLLATPGTADVGFVLASGLLVLFIGTTTRTVRRGDQVVCRCFGTTSAPLGPVHLWRDSVLLAGAAVGLATEGLAGTPTATGLVAAGCAAGFCVILLVRLDDAVALFTGRGVHRTPFPIERAT
jgi:Methylamine utilisation protein MauE